MIKSGDVKFESVHGRKSVYDIRYESNNKLKPLLIFCHGFKGFKDWGHFNLIADSFAASGVIVLKFNFTFNGGTENNSIDFPDLLAFSENNYLKEVQDIHHMIDLIESKKIDLPEWNGEVFLLGHSRGGGMVTIAGSANKTVSKVISWAGISDCVKRLPDDEAILEWKQTGVSVIKNGRTHQDMPMKYQFVETLLNNKEVLSIESAAKSMNKPHLIIHGDDDVSVPINNAEDLFRWNPNSEFTVIPNANHVFGGKHPWLENKLPSDTVKAIEKSINFLLK